MSNRSLRVGLVGLGEAGNLGDDLILIATVDAVYATNPEAQIAFLSFGHELDWERLAEARGYPAVPRRVRERFEIPLARQNSQVYRDRDVVIFGGGGLLQTSHDADQPYHWLSYLPEAGTRTPRVLAAGLGLGPLSHAWMRRLRRMDTPFDLAWLRDPDSVSLSENELGWPAEECRDFIDRTFLATLSVPGTPEKKTARRLGVALRAWPGFTVEAAGAHIASIATRHGCEEMVFFILESNRGRGVDVDFAAEVARRVSLPTRIRAYQAGELTEFLADMATVDLAVSMKLHSSAIWGALEIPMYPVYYAPKVAALFGAEYRGFQVLDTIVQMPPEGENVPRANDIVAAGLCLLSAKEHSSGARFPVPRRYWYQSRHLFKAVGRRVWTRLPLQKRVVG